MVTLPNYSVLLVCLFFYVSICEKVRAGSSGTRKIELTSFIDMVIQTRTGTLSTCEKVRAGRSGTRKIELTSDQLQFVSPPPVYLLVKYVEPKCVYIFYKPLRNLPMRPLLVFHPCTLRFSSRRDFPSTYSSPTGAQATQGCLITLDSL
jgi:hypothetical protein